jgi:hypothetical protein
MICQDEQFEDLGCAEECTAWAAEWQKDTNKYVSTPWRWNLMVTFLSLTFTIIFAVHLTAQWS